MSSSPGRPVIVITGASAGIGRAAATALAGRAELVLVGRDPARMDATVTAVRDAGGVTPLSFLADFASFEEVRKLATKVREACPRIDVLVNNAGLFAVKPSATVDGYETTVQVNHLSGFLLSNLLRDRLAGGRMITTASDAHRAGRIDPDDLKVPAKYRPLRAYQSSKQANVLFTREAARRWAADGILATCFHPGGVATNIGDDSRAVRVLKATPFFRSPEKGARTLLWLIDAADESLTGGGYYQRERLRRPAPRAADDELAARLWDASATATRTP